jgi:protein-tyrosine phosphatase
MKNFIRLFSMAILYLFVLPFNTANAQVADSSQRLIKVTGATNFRDAGGYKTKDGRHVKWAKVYRSAALNGLTNSDLDTIRQRHIVSVVDFRSSMEMKQAKDRLPAGMDYQLCPQGSEGLGQWMKMIPKLNSADSLMESIYGNVDSLKERNRIFFSKLLSLPDTAAILFHCTAGKDRTGITAALFLYEMNVPMETIMEDYLASNVYRQKENKIMANQMVTYLHAKQQVADEIVGVKRQYLETTFAAIIKRYGSIDQFMKQEMGIGPKQLKILRSKYTE